METGEIKTDKHKKVLRFLLDNDNMYLPDLEAIMEVTASVFKTLEKKGYIEIVEKQIERNPFINKHVEKDEAKVLNKEQKRAYDAISYCIENNEPTQSLIYGITGSRKNRNIYAIN